MTYMQPDVSWTALITHALRLLRFTHKMTEVEAVKNAK